MTRRLTVLALVALVVAGCGSGSDDDPGDSSGPLVVSAASSLQKAFTDYATRWGGGNVRFSFAGSDELAAQIQQGVKPDVFASANTKLPDELHSKDLVEKPTVFAGNRLVLAVPAKSDKVGSLEDVERPGVRVAIGSETVPIGSYTLGVLGRLPQAERAKIMANVRSKEPDVKGIVGKLTQGAVDAGFVYITDVKAANGALEAIELPESLKPSAAYGVAVVKGAKHPDAARRFISGLIRGGGRRALLAAGFEPPPQ
ncbi:MAG TPA: molybdate ABC transporter substrate-binding protein [Thermoleophilaceae bacterium]|jgi:molybdate transport system substrate-binding protein